MSYYSILSSGLQGGIRYGEQFQTLINIREDSELAAIFPNCGIETLSAPQGSVLSYLFSGNVPDPSIYCGKNIRRKIKALSMLLDQELEAARYEPKKLGALQKVAKQIFFQGKTTILKLKIEIAGLSSPKMTAVMERLNELLQRVVSTPRFENPRVGGLSFTSSSFPMRQIVPAYSPASWALHPMLQRFAMQSLPSSSQVENPKLRRSKSLSDLADNKKGTRKEQTPKGIPDMQLAKVEVHRRQKMLLQKQLVLETLIYQPNYGSGWEKKLTDKIGKIQERDLLAAIASEVEAIQLLAIVSSFIDHPSEGWKLIYLIGGARHPVFLEFLCSMPPENLRFINGVILRAESDDRVWFEENFGKLRDGFINKCNWMRDRIDEMANCLRKDVKGHMLSYSHLQYIDEYRDIICLRIKALTEFLPPLLEGLTLHPNTRKVLFAEIPAEYNLLLKRLQDNVDESQLPPGSIWPIIYGNAFDQAELTDADTAFDAFAEWSITSFENYREVGLAGELQETEWERLKSATNLHTFCCIAQLEKLNIKTVSDWKRVNVFNKNLLKHFLLRKENQEVLTSASRELLSQNS